jgi:hypothetical protein
VLGQDGNPCGEGFYVRYEMWLRRQWIKGFNPKEEINDLSPLIAFLVAHCSLLI